MKTSRCLLGALFLACTPAPGPSQSVVVEVGGEHFVSSSAVQARDRYNAAVNDARQKLTTVLRQAQAEVMKAGKLEEANALDRAIFSPDEAGELTSLRAKAALTAYRSALDRAAKRYLADLKAAMALSLRDKQLEEANRLANAVKALEAAQKPKPPKPAAVPGVIDLLPVLRADADTVSGTWTVENGAVTSSGEGEERLQLPYRPPAEYDFKIVFTKLSGSNCVVQHLAQGDKPFIWVMSTRGSHTFHYLKGAGTGKNKTSVKGTPIAEGEKHTSIVRVRKDSVEAELDGTVISKWETDFSDVVVAPFWALRDRTLLGLGSGDARTAFHTVEVKEISGPGKLLRKPGGK